MKAEFKRRKSQQGVFTIEAAFVIGLLVFMMLFLADIAIQLLSQTQAQRISYSLTTALKERSRFFEGRQAITQQDFEVINELASDLLSLQAPSKRDGYGLFMESLTDTGVQSFSKSFDSGSNCNPDTSIGNMSHLIPVRQDGARFPIYQVTICIKVDGLLNAVPGLRHISSSSLLPGR
jgi:tight adherence protein F